MGRVVVGEDEDTGMPTIVAASFRPHVDEKLQQHAFEKFLEKYGKGKIALDLANTDDSLVSKLWEQARKNLPGKIKFEPNFERYYYDPEGKQEAVQAAPLDYQKNVKEHNKHLAAVAEEAYSAFTSGNFKEIGEGVCGKKGIVTINGNEYFIKSEQGSEAPEFENIDLTKNETTYNNCVNAAFPDMSKYYTNKLRLSADTFIADAIKLERKPPNENVEEPITHIKLALINYLLGNNDRHTANMDINSEGHIRLFDEGLTIEAEHGFERIPAYVTQETKNSIPDTAHLFEYFHEEKRDTIEQEMRDNGINDEAIDRFNQRWERCQQAIYSAEIS